MDFVYEIGKYVLNGVLATIIGAVAYFGKSTLNRLSTIEKDKVIQDRLIYSLEAKLGTRVSVMESQVKDIQLDIKEIKEGINKLMDKLL